MHAEVTSDNSALSLTTHETHATAIALRATPNTDHCNAIGYYLEASLAPNTVRAYRSDLRMFLRGGGAIPSSPEALAAHLARYASVLSPYTLARRLSAIRRAHKTLGLPDPAEHAMVRGVMQGIWRRHGKAQRQARPLLLSQLHQMLPSMIGRKGVRDRALLLLGFRAALRRSELCNLDDDDCILSDDGVLLHLRHSKTDPQAKGRVVAVPFSPTDTCAVRALLAWREASQLQAGPMFRSIDRWGVLGGRLSAQSVSTIVRAYAREAGIDPCGLSAHSLRAGFVTSAANAGLPVHAIQQQTGHRSLEMLFRYVRSSDPFNGNANQHVGMT